MLFETLSPAEAEERKAKEREIEESEGLGDENFDPKILHGDSGGGEARERPEAELVNPARKGFKELEKDEAIDGMLDKVFRK